MASDENNEARGCFIVVGTVCVSIGLGFVFGQAVGWITFGGFLVAIAVLDAVLDAVMSK